MENERTHWNVLAEIRARRLGQLSQSLRIDEAREQRVDEALRQATKRLLVEMRHQLGAILIERIEPTDIEDILIDLAREVGATVNSARTDEGLKEARQNAGDLLSALVSRSSSEGATQ